MRHSTHDHDSATDQATENPSMFDRLFGKNNGSGTEKPQNPFPNGPQRFKVSTNGQKRRRQARDQIAEAKKADRSYRRNFYKRQRAESVRKVQEAMLRNPERYTVGHRQAILEAAYAKHLAAGGTQPSISDYLASVTA